MTTQGRWARSTGWIARHWRSLGLVAGGLIAGAVIGWWAGSFTACASDGCKTRVDSIEAVGTWVGGVGTILAVLAAVAAFRGDEDARREEIARLARTRREQYEFEESEAARVTVGAAITTTQGTSVLAFDLWVTNGARSSRLHDLVARSAEWGTVGKTPRTEAGKEAVRRALHLGSDRGNTRPAPFPVPADSDEWVRATVDSVTVEFEMNHQRWRRVGNRPVERIDPS